jgi:hypothetical protein
MAVNGKTVAEQIGGQIFIDSWGLVYPDDAKTAGARAALAARVSHDGNGVHGAVFIAALISLAFTRTDLPEMIEEALNLIPADSEYARVVKAVRDFHRDHPASWRECRDFLTENFGYDRYPGVCHIIPNAGIIALSLYYGEGDFARTIEIATMGGWDTDCNAGNAGTILGVMAGPEGIPDHYRKPINDFHAASSIAGALNILDLPTTARELAILGLEQAGLKIPPEWLPGSFSDDLVFDFSLSGSTHGFRSSSDFLLPLRGWSPREEASGSGGGGKLSLVIDRMQRGDAARVFHKPFYRREDFDDERYSPVFTPLVYPGQRMEIDASLEKFSGQRISIAPYVRDSRSKKILNGHEVFPGEDTPLKFSWTIPEVDFAVDEAGLLVQGIDSEKFLGQLEIHRFSITGKKSFRVNFSDETHEFRGLSRCSLSGGAWSFEEGRLHVITNESFLLNSGPYYVTDADVEAVLTPCFGESHLVMFRSIGAERGYFFGLQGEGRAALLKRDHTNTTLAEADFTWEEGREYTLKVQARGGTLECFIDGVKILTHEDPDPIPSGMAGLAKWGAGRTLFRSLTFREV